MSEPLTLCPVCHKEQPVGGALFCPFCGASLAVKAPVPEAAQAALDACQRTDDPVKKHQLLTDAIAQCPDCLELEQELLLLGNLYKRNPKSPSYDVIKCFLLHMYLTPEQFTKEKRAAMRAELFEHELLKRCQALAPDEDAFTLWYLERLSGEFVRLFLEGSNYYMHSVFGFTFKKNAAKTLAQPAASMLNNMRADGGLTTAQRDMLMTAFFTAFSRQMDGETACLMSELKRLGCELPH